MKEPRRFGVVKTEKPPRDKEAVSLLDCRRCLKDVGVAHSEWQEIKLGGYLKGGRLVGFERVIVCAQCYRRGHLEIVGRL